MKKITAIKIQKNNKERVNIEIDGEYAFSLHIDLVMLYKLKKDMEVEELWLENVILEDEKKKAFQQALQYISYTSRTEYEVSEYLKKKGYLEEAVRFAVHKIKNYGYINDQAIAKSVVKSKVQALKSKAFVFQKLRQKGIEENIYKDVIEKHYGEEIEEKNARVLAEKYLKKYMMKYMEHELKGKIAQGVMSKGYNWQVVQKAVEEVMSANSAQIEEQKEHIESKKCDELGELIDKYAKKYMDKDPKEAKYKIKQVLYKKGYSLKDIESILDERNE